MESERWKGLPEDILIRVLACLPTLVVVKLRAVCKRWNQLISSAHAFPPNVPLSSTPAFLICWSHWLTSYPKYLVIGGSYDCPPTTHLSRLSLHFLPTQLDSFKVVAACKSLLCCSYDREPTIFYICNPATRTYVHLPRPHQLTSWDFIALDLDTSAKRCKLIVGRKRTVQRGQFNTVVEIYDSRTNSWTELQMTTRPSVNPQGEGIYSKGVLYWINETLNGVPGCRYDVVGFNVNKRSWDVITHPRTPKERLQFWQLSGRDGRVVLIYENDLSLWELIEDADEDFAGKRWRWSPLPRCAFDLTDDDMDGRICFQVAVNCGGWVLIYLPRKKMVVFDAEGRIVVKIEGEDLSMLAESGRYPTSVRGFEANNIWWP